MRSGQDANSQRQGQSSTHNLASVYQYVLNHDKLINMWNKSSSLFHQGRSQPTLTTTKPRRMESFWTLQLPGNYISQGVQQIGGRDTACVHCPGLAKKFPSTIMLPYQKGLSTHNKNSLRRLIFQFDGANLQYPMHILLQNYSCLSSNVQLIHPTMETANLSFI